MNTMDFDDYIMKLNVGGRIFETTPTTVKKAGKNSPLGKMSCVASLGHFIDRDPDYFAVLLNLLRTGELHMPSNLNEKLLYKEALYYGILDNVKLAKFSPFDGNRLKLARSIMGWSARDVGHEVMTQVIRASQSTGWCCVAHGSVVHVYNWMMEQHPIIHLEYKKVNDVCWVDAENIVVSSNGSMGLFSASTGELRYKFLVTNERNCYIPGVLCANSDYNLFSNCGSISSEHGIGVWDQVTGKQIDFWSYNCSNSKSSKLQWLNSTNCLMVTSFHPMNENCCISLLDFREKNIVALLWCDSFNKPYITDEAKFRDVLAIEESNSICVVNENERLAFLDLRRMASKSVNWRRRLSSYTGENSCYTPCYPKLAFHEGQLFSSMGDRIFSVLWFSLGSNITDSTESWWSYL